MKYTQLYDVEMWKRKAAELTTLLRETISCTKARQEELDRCRSDVAQLRAENQKLRSLLEKKEGADSSHLASTTARSSEVNSMSLNGVHYMPGAVNGVSTHEDKHNPEQLRQLKSEVAELKLRLDTSKKHLSSERKLSSRWKAEAAILRSRSLDSSDTAEILGDTASADESIVELTSQLEAAQADLGAARLEIQREREICARTMQELRQEHEEQKSVLCKEVKSLFMQCEAHRKIVHKLKAAIKAQTVTKPTAEAVSISSSNPPPPVVHNPPEGYEAVFVTEMKSFHGELLRLQRLTTKVVGRMREITAAN